MTTPTDSPLTLGRFFRQMIGLAAIMILALSGYLIVLKWRGHAAQLCTYTSLDELVPYQPLWVWVYLIPYIIGPLIVGFMRPETFRWYVTRGLAIVGLTLVIFIAVPTQTAERPCEKEGPDALAHGLSGWTKDLYEMMISVDKPPANAAPSLHVSLTCLLALALFRDFPRWWPLTVIGVGSVWLATLYTRQHHLIDVVTGALLALMVVYVSRSRQAASVGRNSPMI